MALKKLKGNDCLSHERVGNMIKTSEEFLLSENEAVESLPELLNCKMEKLFQNPLVVLLLTLIPPTKSPQQLLTLLLL